VVTLIPFAESLLMNASYRTDDHFRLMLIVFCLSGADGDVEVVIAERRILDGVAEFLRVGRFDAARN